MLEAYQLLEDRWLEITYGVGIAVAIVAFGRAIASGVFAPDAPGRRLLALDDAAAQGLARHLVWGAWTLGALLFALVVHRVLDAPPVLFVASNMLFALAIAGLLLHLLLGSAGREAQPEGEAAPHALWLRAIAWLFVAVIVISLIAGYAGFAGFVGQRLLSTVAVLGLLYLLLVLTQASLVERLAADTPRSRALAANSASIRAGSACSASSPPASCARCSC